jgi:DNA-binding transcriptional MocR family regulator
MALCTNMPLLLERKLLGPGFRLGWVLGPPAVVSKVSLYIAAISVGAASISQVGAQICLVCVCFSI